MLLKPCTLFGVTYMCGESLQECIEMRSQFTQNLQPEGADAPQSTNTPQPQPQFCEGRSVPRTSHWALGHNSSVLGLIATSNKQVEPSP